MTGKETEAREISVIVVSYQSRGTIGRCLEALQRQSATPREVILVDSGDDGTAELVESEYPWVRLVRSSVRLFPGDARNVGIEAAAGRVIAFVDSDCEAEADWVGRIAEAHQGEEWIIGGSVGVANPEYAAGWGQFLTEFSGWLKTGERRWMDEIPTCCLSFKREAYEAFGPFVEGCYCSDTVFHWKARAAGRQALFVPEIHVRHWNPLGLRRSLEKQKMHGATFARLRAEYHGWGRGRSVAWALGAALLPAVLLGRIARRVAGLRYYRIRFLQALPAVVLGVTWWSWGEAKGYWNAR